MRVLKGIDGLRALERGAVLSIGNFDGVHRGHQELLGMMRRLRGPGGGPVAVVTFEPHPLTVLKPQLAPPRLTPLARKDELFEQQGVEAVVVLPPTKDVLGLTAENFWQILRDDVKPSHLVEGASFAFGRGRGGTVQRLQEWSVGTDVKVHVADAVEAVLLDLQVVAVSSSLIRWLLVNGRVRDAAICLGRPYALEGPVVRGHERGRGIGMPTANLRLDEQLVPADGVYAGRCMVDGTQYPAAISIGTMPTFGENARQIEAHLLGFDGDLYDRPLSVEMLDWLRDQRRYATVEELMAQMRQDLRTTRRLAGQDLTRQIAAVQVAS